MLFQDLAKETLGGSLVSAACDQDIEDVTILINGSPTIMMLAADGDEQLVHVPDVTSRPCRRRRVRAYAGPNFRHQDRMASGDTVMPRLRANRWYSQTAWLMISGGKRWRRYSDSMSRFSPTAANLTTPGRGLSNLMRNRSEYVWLTQPPLNASFPGSVWGIWWAATLSEPVPNPRWLLESTCGEPPPRVC